MARRKSTRRKSTKTRRRAGRPKRGASRRRAARKPRGRLQETWDSTLAALGSAEARMEKQVRALLRRSKISTKDASSMLRDLNAMLSRERKKAAKELEGRLAGLQARARKERRAIARMVDDAVQSALAAFNIPSRQEVHQLTRKVNELSRKIDRFRR